MVNVTTVPAAAVGDEVVLIGRQGGEEITLEEVSEKMGTLACVPPSLIGKRVPRVYIDRGSQELNL